MPHITLNTAEPGIRGLLRFRPETGGPLSELAEVLLRGPGTLTRGERELIAAYVSGLNDCQYCSASHSACAAAQLPEGMALVDQVRADASGAPVSGKLKALLAIAAAVQRGGLQVTDEHVTYRKVELRCGSHVLSEAENWYVDRVALYTVPRSASPPDCYIIIQVMAERSPSPSQKRSTSNVFLTGSLPQTARAYSEYVYFEYAPLR